MTSPAHTTLAAAGIPVIEATDDDQCADRRRFRSLREAGIPVIGTPPSDPRAVADAAADQTSRVTRRLTESAGPSLMQLRETVWQVPA